VSVFERHLLRVERALHVVVERVDLLRRGADPAAHGGIGVLSKLATPPRGDATVEQPPERIAGNAGIERDLPPVETGDSQCQRLAARAGRFDHLLVGVALLDSTVGLGAAARR